MHRHRPPHREFGGKRLEPGGDDEDEPDEHRPLPSWLVDEHPKKPERERGDFEAMAILIAAGQPISDIDRLSLDELHFAAELVEYGQSIRRHDDLKAQLAAFR